jgi:signal transduction histidine kinase
MRISAAGVRIRVTDTGRPRGSAGPAGSAESSAASGTAHLGIVGMRERAAVFGGTLDAAPLPGGGFRVAAFLPVSTSGPAGLPAGGPAVTAGRVA